MVLDEVMRIEFIGVLAVLVACSPLSALEDSDRDGIANHLEDSNGNGIVDVGETDPNNPDTDGDGLPDGVEDRNANGIVDPGETSGALADSDGDGFDDSAEDSNKNGVVDPGETNPALADSDNDGLDDQVEDSNHNHLVDSGETDPTNADTDNDGLLDGVEVGWTDPLDSDSDDDSLPDGVEDEDGDGVVDVDETDPTNPNSDGDLFCDASRIDNDDDGLDPEDGCTGQEVIYVSQSQRSSASDGKSWGTALSSLSEAIDLAQAGQQVWVSNERFVSDSVESSGSLQPVLTLKSNVSIYGGFTGTELSRSNRNGRTVLDGENKTRVVFASNAANVTLDGFEIVRGKDSGGGLINLGGSLSLTNVVFHSNQSDGAGGAIWNLGAMILLNVLIYENVASIGGGIANGSDSDTKGVLEMSNVVFYRNAVETGPFGGRPQVGGLVIASDSTADLTNVVFYANEGEGMANGGTTTILSATFYNNSTGGILNKGRLFGANVTFDGNSVAGRAGGLISEDNSEAILTNATFYGNRSRFRVPPHGGALDALTQSKVVITNGVFYDNRASFVKDIGTLENNPEHNDVYADATSTVQLIATCAESKVSDCTLTDDPFASASLPIIQRLIDPQRGQMLIDSGDSSAASDAIGESWRALTSRADLRPEGGSEVDRSRLYHPGAVVITEFRVVDRTISWASKNAKQCILLLDGPVDVKPTGSLNRDVTGFDRIALVCFGNVGEPTVAEVTL